MEQKSSGRTKPKSKKIRFSTPKIQRVFLAEDFDGCTLVVPEGFATYKQITLYQGSLQKYQL